jgi:hypothetical protein
MSRHHARSADQEGLFAVFLAAADARVDDVCVGEFARRKCLHKIILEIDWAQLRCEGVIVGILSFFSFCYSRPLAGH